MHKFGSTGLVTGYIKQLLASFNLPKTRIYTKEHEAFFETHGKESPYIIESFERNASDKTSVNIPTENEAIKFGLIPATEEDLQVTDTCLVPYIKEGRIQFYLGGYYNSSDNFTQGKWQEGTLSSTNPTGGDWTIYDKGKYYPNLTKTLQIKNNIYDSYTHEYLGDYLRFLRDYDGIDLMPLYNCFSNRTCNLNDNLKLTVEKATSANTKFGVFDSTDSDYKIYILPVKFFKEYTIAIDSAYPIEICCGFYNSKLNTSSEEYGTLSDKTYFRQTISKFNKPFLYSALTDLAVKELPRHPLKSDIARHLQERRFLAKIASNEIELKMFLKVSKQVSSSIVILEGNYCTWNDFTAKLVPTNPNSSNFLERSSKKLFFQQNHTVLSDMAIFADHKFDLITPLQLLRLNTGEQMPFADRLIEYLLDSCINGGEAEVRENVLMAQQLVNLRYNTLYGLVNGVWDDALTKIFYRYMTEDSKIHDYASHHDNLGYIDKDVENLFKVTKQLNTGKKISKTMINFDTWKELEE